MSRRTDEPERSHCPCGQALAAQGSGHVLCATHRQQVVRGVRRRFGLHRYGGRYAPLVDDFVNDCYEKLLRPGGVDSYRPEIGCFGAWLNLVVRNFCHNKVDYVVSHPDFDGESLDSAHETAHSLSPDQAFARRCVLDLVRDAVAEVEADWKARGPTAGQRFDVFLPFVLGEEACYEEAQRTLGVTAVNARRIKFELGEDILLALRRRVRDTLFLKPGLDHASVERRIDEEIEELLKAAFPDGSEPIVMRTRPKPAEEPPEPESEKEPESDP